MTAIKKHHVDRFWVPNELEFLLNRWGRCYMEGGPRLKYPTVSAGFEWYRSKATEPLDPPKYDIAAYDLMCEIIDNYIDEPRTQLLKNKYRHRLRVRESAENLGWAKWQVHDEFEKTIKKINYLLNQG